MSNELTKSEVAIPVISAIIERTHRGERQILVQTRVAKYDQLYFGCLEIPAGRIDAFENVFNTIPREVQEETGLEVTEILPKQEVNIIETQRGDAGFVFKSYCCQQLLRGNIPWVGFVFLVRVRDQELQTTGDETKDIRWISTSELSRIVREEPEKVFTLQLPMLVYYLRDVETGG